MSADTPRTWPEGEQPTAQQAADWLTVCTDDERLRFAEWALRAGDSASECFAHDHAGAVEELLSLRHKYAGAYDEGYQRGWNDAVHAALEMLDDNIAEATP